MLKFVLLISLALTSALQASERQKILNIINTDNISETASIYLVTEENKIKSFELETEKKTTNISLRSVRKGKTLLRKKGVKVIHIRAKNLSQTEGGNFKIRFLKKFRLFSSKYENLTLSLKKNNESWEFIKNGSPIKEILITPYSLGISEIELI